MAAAPPPTGPARAWLDLARAAFFEELYRGKTVLWVGVGDGRPIEVLLERGAARVTGVDLDAQTAQAAEKRLAGRAEVKSGAPSVVSGRFDLVACGCGELVVQRSGFIAQLLDRLAPGGWLVVAAASADAAGAQGGVGYYELLDKIAPHFRAVTMMGQGALAGATVAPFGDEGAEPVLDAGLAGAAEATLYVAVAGPRRAELGYGLIVLPPEASEAGDRAAIAEKIERLEAELKGVGPALVRAREEAEARRRVEARAAEMERNLHLREHRIAELLSEGTVRAAQLEQARARAVELESAEQRGREQAAAAQNEKRVAELDRRLAAEVEARGAADSAREQLAQALAAAQRELEEAKAEAGRQRARGDGSATADIEARLQARERGMEELREAAAAHAGEVRALEAKLDERDAYLAELERDLEQAEKAHAQRRAVEVRLGAAEARERSARQRVAELEGTLIREGRAVPPAATEGAAPAPSDGAHPELEAQVAKLKAQLADAQREAWAHLKARSDAEAQAAEVREDTVRKLKDARKIANVELMRAMEEATKKAVSLKEELARTEVERKQTLAELRQARERLQQRDVPGADEIRAELAKIEQLVVGEGQRLGGIEEGLRRAVAAVAAAEFGYERAP